MTVDELDFDKGNGLVTVVTQDAVTGAVLMVAHMDREALAKTLESGEMHYHSRTRGLWHKGETSGNTQGVVTLTPDCDRDAVLARVRPAGPACHNGTVSCFEHPSNGDALTALAAVIESRVHDAQEGSYTQKLLADRNLRLKKLGEETAELVLALADGDGERATEEAADLMYHVMVALRALGVSLDNVRRTLGDRQ
ncbi:MAG: bifunctional phosphoribosyl-AMP cyclohydrolase/phosphoribosyl-ATP diphosphatase HisIE [Gemmatimonadaceae bacterium]